MKRFLAIMLAVPLSGCLGSGSGTLTLDGIPGAENGLVCDIQGNLVGVNTAIGQGTCMEIPPEEVAKLEIKQRSNTVFLLRRDGKTVKTYELERRGSVNGFTRWRNEEHMGRELEAEATKAQTSGHVHRSGGAYADRRSAKPHEHIESNIDNSVGSWGYWSVDSDNFGATGEAIDHEEVFYQIAEGAEPTRAILNATYKGRWSGIRGGHDVVHGGLEIEVHSDAESISAAIWRTDHADPDFREWLARKEYRGLGRLDNDARLKATYDGRIYRGSNTLEGSSFEAGFVGNGAVGKFHVDRGGGSRHVVGAFGARVE